ncbi:MAG: dihydropyrimidine dehydrogenase [Robiginitomaculum sp.]|nr:MAG: dihydropyrimidine dehydrogenase [Robiginitomaculum sp.]
MTQTMLKFARIPGKMPQKRDSKLRSADFDEVYQNYLETKAREQASRCSQCGVPFCQNHCPLQNNIPDWLQLAAEGQMEQAYRLSAQTNFMPEICGRICPQDRLCEGACVVEQSGHGTITIGAIEKHLTDTAWANGWVTPLRPRMERNLSAGIVGAGPAGLAAAEHLRELGWQVSVYDRYDRAGGLLMYGIPNFKLDKDIVQRRIKRLQDGGIQFVLNTEIGRDISLADLRAKHQAVLLAIGVYAAHRLGVPGSEGVGTIEALPYLVRANKRGLGDQVSAQTAKGKKVVVVGGGDTAMDCVRTAIREGADTVTCLYRRDEANMPGSHREMVNAQEEGVDFSWLAAPNRIVVKNDKVQALQVSRMQLGQRDSSGRQSFSVIADEDFKLEADLVIEALGFAPEELSKIAPDLKLSPWKTVEVHPTRFETSLSGVFAAGDIVRGASLVVWAIREGRDAAKAMHVHLLAQQAEAQT